MSRWIQPEDNQDITNERKKGTFDTERMSAWIHGGVDVLKVQLSFFVSKTHCLTFLASSWNPRFCQIHWRFQRSSAHWVYVSWRTNSEQCQKSSRYDRQYWPDWRIRLFRRRDVLSSVSFSRSQLFLILRLTRLTMGRDLHAMSLHYVMFIPTLQGQTDDEQLDEWLTKAISRAIVGTYAQTELGHGTNLSKLETTATYDPKTEEFVLNSPTITAAKWVCLFTQDYTDW